jgi:hypothetical protein
MQETTDYIDNVVDIIYACRKRNSLIGARLRHFYFDDRMLLVYLTDNKQLKIPVLIATHGISQLTEKSIFEICSTFNERII